MRSVIYPLRASGLNRVAQLPKTTHALPAFRLGGFYGRVKSIHGEYQVLFTRTLALSWLHLDAFSFGGFRGKGTHPLEEVQLRRHTKQCDVFFAECEYLGRTYGVNR